MLQRSVTLIRRLLCGRPNESISRSGAIDDITKTACLNGRSVLVAVHYSRTSAAAYRISGRSASQAGRRPGWIHSSLPSAQISFFQIGTTSLSVSISHRHASNAS